MKILIFVVCFSNSIENQFVLIKDFGIIMNRIDSSSLISYNHKFFDTNRNKVFYYSDSKLVMSEDYVHSIDDWKGIILEKKNYFDSDRTSKIEEIFISGDMLLEYTDIEKLHFLHPIIQVKNDRVLLLKSKNINSKFPINLIHLDSISERSANTITSNDIFPNKLIDQLGKSKRRIITDQLNLMDIAIEDENIYEFKKYILSIYNTLNNN